MTDEWIGQSIFDAWHKTSSRGSFDERRKAAFIIVGAKARELLAEPKQEIVIRLDASDAIAQIDSAVAKINAAVAPSPTPNDSWPALSPVARAWMDRAEVAERRLADIRAECERLIRLHEATGGPKSGWLSGTHGAAGTIARAAGFHIVIADERPNFRVVDPA